MTALSCHVLIDDLPPSESSPILRNLQDILSGKYQIRHSTIQFECDKHAGACCGTSTLYCRFEAGGETHGAEEVVPERVESRP
jgi:hypothetical protein